MKNKEKYASKEKEKAKEINFFFFKLHVCKHVFQEMWELYDITLYVMVTFKLM